MRVAPAVGRIVSRVAALYGHSVILAEALVLGWLLSDRTPGALAIVAAIAILGGAGLDAGFRALLVDLP